ncbi:MAG TPA: carbohydrate ABC transporter permease [Jiangellaceae bacterium]
MTTTGGPTIPPPPPGRLTTTTAPRKLTKAELRAAEAKTKLTSPWASGIAIVIAILWTIPTFGVLLSSIRPQASIQSSGWWTWFTNPEFTIDNYDQVLFGTGTAFSTFFINSVTIAIPSVLIPVTLALLAAYAFAWIEFRGRDLLFVAVFSLQIVPLQIALIPLLQEYVNWGLAGSFWTVWISHSIFALPLAIFLLHNFMKDIPPSLIEAARVDGAGHVKIFFRVLLPLLVPAIAAYGIFQFLWIWNDLLVALTMAGGTPNVAPLTVRLAELSGSRGADWHLLTAGALVAIIVPLIVFLSLQRFFVRGMLSGSVKG